MRRKRSPSRPQFCVHQPDCRPPEEFFQRSCRLCSYLLGRTRVNRGPRKSRVLSILAQVRWKAQPASSMHFARMGSIGKSGSSREIFLCPASLVLITTDEDARPRLTQVLTWNLAPSFNAEAFTFDPPQDAQKIAIAEVDRMLSAPRHY